MSASVTERRCDDCGTSLAELNRDERGDLLCVQCYGLRQGSPRWTLHSSPASSWAPVDLEPILAGDHEDEEPGILRRTDGIGLLYAGRLHAISAEPEAGKGWLALTAAQGVLETGVVVYIDYEDTASNVVGRLRDLGVQDAVILARFRYVRPDEPVTDADLVVALGAALVVIDGVTEALAVEGLDMASNQDVAAFYNRLPRPLANSGATVVLIDHVVKDKEARGRYAIGAQHKLAGVDVAYRLDVIRPFARGREGLVKVTVTKDRPGYVRQHAVDRERVAMFRGRSGDNGRMVTSLEPPEPSSDPLRPTCLMERISREVEQRPGMNKGSVRAVRGNSNDLDIALEALIREAFVDARPERNSIRHYSLKPFRETS